PETAGSRLSCPPVPAPGRQRKGGPLVLSVSPVLLDIPPGTAFPGRTAFLLRSASAPAPSSSTTVQEGCSVKPAGGRCGLLYRCADSAIPPFPGPPQAPLLGTKPRSINGFPPVAFSGTPCLPALSLAPRGCRNRHR